MVNGGQTYRLPSVENPEWDIAEWKGAFKGNPNWECHVHCYLHFCSNKAGRVQVICIHIFCSVAMFHRLCTPLPWECIKHVGP
jgi:hypothetical protein